jgi:hypothetical protein
MAYNFALVVQYNDIHRRNGDLIVNFTIPQACDIMTQKDSTSLQRYAAVQDRVRRNVLRDKCISGQYLADITALKGEQWNSSQVEHNGNRQWTYQTCTEFGYFQTSAFGSKVPFGDFPLKYSTKQCQDIFGDK